ncbi:hypothetical protein KM043_001629 [Ampulex compressa]|nr:hypothetical protein KM043_001629 [Ampulex compressa]
MGGPWSSDKTGVARENLSRVSNRRTAIAYNVGRSGEIRRFSFESRLENRRVRPSELLSAEGLPTGGSAISRIGLRGASRLSSGRNPCTNLGADPMLSGRPDVGSLRKKATNGRTAAARRGEARRGEARRGEARRRRRKRLDTGFVPPPVSAVCHLDTVASHCREHTSAPRAPPPPPSGHLSLTHRRRSRPILEQARRLETNAVDLCLPVFLQIRPDNDSSAIRAPLILRFHLLGPLREGARAGAVCAQK